MAPVLSLALAHPLPDELPDWPFVPCMIVTFHVGGLATRTQPGLGDSSGQARAPTYQHVNHRMRNTPCGLNLGRHTQRSPSLSASTGGQ